MPSQPKFKTWLTATKSVWKVLCSFALANVTLENGILVTRQRKCFILIFWHTRSNLNKRTAPRLLPHYFLPMMKIWAISNFQLWPRNSYSLRFLRTFTLNRKKNNTPTHRSTPFPRSVSSITWYYVTSAPNFHRLSCTLMTVWSRAYIVYSVPNSL